MSFNTEFNSYHLLRIHEWLQQSQDLTKAFNSLLLFVDELNTNVENLHKIIEEHKSRHYDDSR